MTPQQLSERLWQFAARIAKVVDALPETRVGRHVASQIVRSGVAVAPNYNEARSGESRANFVHKVNVALKELVENPRLAQIHHSGRVAAWQGGWLSWWRNATSFAASGKVHCDGQSRQKAAPGDVSSDNR